MTTMNKNNEYSDVLIPDMIKDIAKQAVAGNAHSKTRLEMIQRYCSDVLQKLDEPTPWFSPNGLNRDKQPRKR